MFGVSQPVNTRISHPSRQQPRTSELLPVGPLSPKATVASLSALSLARSSGSLTAELTGMAIEAGSEGSPTQVSVLEPHEVTMEKAAAASQDGPPSPVPTFHAAAVHQGWNNLPTQPPTPLAPVNTRPRKSVDKSHHVVSDVQDGPSAGDSRVEVTTSPTNTATVKFLVNTAWATAIIGRGGCNVRDLSSSSGCHVQLSDKTSFYPGTKSRVLLLRGGLDALRTALVVVLRRRDELPIQSANPTDIDYISMLVPSGACNEVVDGCYLQELEHSTGAVFTPTQRDKQGPFVPDRIIRVTGTRYVICPVFSVGSSRGSVSIVLSTKLSTGYKLSRRSWACYSCCWTLQSTSSQ